MATQSIPDIAAPNSQILTDKQHEDRLRGMIRRQGHRLVKSRRRNPLAYDFGSYMIVVDDFSNACVAGPNMSFDDVEQWVTTDG